MDNIRDKDQEEVKDLYDSLEEMTFYNSDDAEYNCSGCGYSGDSCDYYNYEGGGGSVETCPECGAVINL